MFVDVAAQRLITARGGEPDPELLRRVDGEVAEALDLFEERGWDAEPERYHQDPVPLASTRMGFRRSGNLRYTALSWLDGYEPRPDEPGAARYAGYRSNRVARAALLEHRAGDRPWVVCLHGFAMGRPGFDLRAFRALHLHRDLGLNVALLTLPCHGRRNPGPSPLPPVPGFDVLDTLHGLAQSVWDVRQLVIHLRERTDQPVALMGLSLGGLVAATTSSFVEVDGVVLLIPAVDLAGLIPTYGPGASTLLAPVSPLRLTSKVPADRKLIVAGTLDRFVRPTDQAVALWRHWDEPTLQWYHGGHVSLFWARGVQAAVDHHLRAIGVSASTAT